MYISIKACFVGLSLEHLKNVIFYFEKNITFTTLVELPQKKASTFLLYKERNLSHYAKTIIGIQGSRESIN